MVRDNAERKKQKFRFAFLYILSIGLLAVIFTALWNMRSSPGQISSGVKSTAVSEEFELIKKDGLLHNNLKKLQQLDDMYAKLLSDSASLQTLDSLSLLIDKSEILFANTIDSIERQKKLFKNKANSVEFDSTISAFKSTLYYRKPFGYMRMALAGQHSTDNEDKRELVKVRMDLQNKNNSILTLQDQINNAKRNTSENTADASKTYLQQIESLQSIIKKDNDKISSLLVNNNSLSKDNNRLTLQVNQLKPGMSAFEGVSKDEHEKNNLLQNKINDLNAMLIFEKIDCNLSRADAKQIISNSRQRRDLLQESLKSLNDLSHSDNLSIQKKAREKLNELQNIVQTVRD